MKLTNLTPIISKKYHNKNGYFLWNSANNKNQLLISIESKQCNTKNYNTQNQIFKDDFGKLTQQFVYLILLFYEF